MAKTKYIPCDIYNREAWVFVGKWEELRKWVIGKFTHETEKSIIEAVANEDCDEITGACTIFNWKSGQGIIWFPKFPSTSEEIGSTVHEIIHLVLNLLDFCEIEYVQNSKHEVIAYLTGWITQNVFDKNNYENIT